MMKITVAALAFSGAYFMEGCKSGSKQVEDDLNDFAKKYKDAKQESSGTGKDAKKCSDVDDKLWPKIYADYKKFQNSEEKDKDGKKSLALADAAKSMSDARTACFTSYGDASAPASAPLMTKWANDNLKGDDLKAAPQVIAALAPIVDGTAN